MNQRRRSLATVADQIRELVTLAGSTAGTGDVILGRPGSGWAGWRQQAGGGQSLADPESLVVGQLRVGGGIEHASDELVDAATALFRRAPDAGDQFVGSPPGHLCHACMLAGMAPRL